MKICTLASGSGGNSTLIWENNTYILVDVGISLRRLKNSLKLLDVDITQISAVFITHEHSDHISGLPMLAKYHTNIPVYASDGTVRTLIKSEKDGGAELHSLIYNEPTIIGNITIQHFETPHDAVQSIGFTFTADNRKIGYATDIGHISPIVSRNLTGSSLVLLEFNHDLDMLWAGRYPYLLKQRIASRYGHLCNAEAADFSQYLADTGTSAFILAHLSEENNRPDLAYNAIATKLPKTSIFVAPPNEIGQTFVVK